MSYLFEILENIHNTRYFQVISNESRKIVNYGLETICCRIRTCRFFKYFQKKNKKLKRRKLPAYVMQNVR